MVDNDGISKIEAIEILHCYNGKKVLDITHLSFTRGGTYAVLGQNGSGKTTLLNILGLLLKPTEGKVLFNGIDVHLDRNTTNAFRNRITTVIQNPVLFDMTVEENIEFGLKIRGVPKEARKKAVAESLKMVRLEGFQNRRARELSGGETQRIAIARALVIKPEVLFLDEFTANVDEKSIEVLEDLVKKINVELGMTVFLVTHDTAQAYRLADTVINLFEGRMVKPSLENLFRGTLRKINDLYLFDTGKMKIEVVSNKEGTAYCAIDPRDIVISIEPLHSSARNSFPGTVFKIMDDDISVRLGIKAGEEFTAKITRDSLAEMQLTLGSTVYLTFKSTAVEVF